MMEFLREHFSNKVVTSDEELPAFVGGGIGYFGFDCAEWYEPSLRSADGSTDASATFMFFRSVIAFDHAKQVVKIVRLCFVDDNDSESCFEDAAQRNAAIRRVLEDGSIDIPKKNGTDPTSSEITSNWTREGFENAVLQIKELILSGDCYQARNLSTLLEKYFRTSRLHLSRDAVVKSFALHVPASDGWGQRDRCVARDAREELGNAARVSSDCRYTTKRSDAHSRCRACRRNALRRKGSRRTPHARRSRRNDLGRVAEYGSVKVDGLMSVEKYSHVQHLVSYLSAKLRAGFDRFDALASCFPAGTVSGAPKVRAIEIIRDIEPDHRGVYAGAVGYFDYAGNMDTCIAIRTMVLKDGVAHVQAGAGIVADSVPASEYEETVNKARGLLKAIELAESR
jgi:anthranilate synthase component 1